MPSRSLPVSFSSHDASFHSTFWSDSDDLDSSATSISSVTVESRTISSRLTLKSTTSPMSFYSARDDDDDDTADTASVLSDVSPTLHLTLTATLSWLQHQFAKPSAKQQHGEATEEDPPEVASVFSMSLWNCEPPTPTSTFSYSGALSDEDDDVELKYEETILQTAYPLLRS
jgi:hypothetical protein